MRIVFMGTPEFAVPSLEILLQHGYEIPAVVTAADKPGGRSGIQESAVKKFAAAHGLRVLQPEKLKNPDFLEALRALRADLQVVVAFRMLPEVVWNMPPLGTLNLHGSLLPKYRGAAPINWAIINGETETGVTTFLLRHEIDTGDILFQEKLPIGENDTAGEVHDRMMLLGAQVVLRTVQAIERGAARPMPQSDAEATHAPKIFTETCRIDFAQPTARVHNFIRGLSPYPGAWTTLDGKTLKILRALKAASGGDTLPPGQFVSDGKNFLKVSTLDGYIEVVELQMEGKRKMDAKNFLNGYKTNTYKPQNKVRETMQYESVDKLQNVLGEEVFHYTKDRKKAAGRALGTLVEIITYYLLKTWGLNNSISVERGLAEYGNSDISHNVEYSLHPILDEFHTAIEKNEGSITANRIFKSIENKNLDKFERKNNTLLSKYNIIRNACTIGEGQYTFLLSSIKSVDQDKIQIDVFEQHQKAYAIFECKRVGVEEGMQKGPQTIEKAKQGAYVARAVSSLQKIRTDDGKRYGIIYKSDNTPHIKPYFDLLEEIVFSNDKELLRKFILTVGVVSNHGNWFTVENQNKEMKVLSQSYDWLLFLTDLGLSIFIEKLILKPSEDFIEIRNAFLRSYSPDKPRNEFTKVQMNFNADKALLKYFSENLTEIESWFNVIAPSGKNIKELKQELKELSKKDWKNILL